MIGVLNGRGATAGTWLDVMVDRAWTTGGVGCLLPEVMDVSGPGEMGGDLDDEVVELAEDAEAERSLPELLCFLFLLLDLMVTMTGDCEQDGRTIDSINLILVLTLSFSHSDCWSSVLSHFSGSRERLGDFLSDGGDLDRSLEPAWHSDMANGLLG